MPVAAFRPPFDIDWDFAAAPIKSDRNRVWERNKVNGPTYFKDIMCIGKGNVPYMPREMRETQTA